MTDTVPCPHCGAPLASDAPAGLCPACLLRSAIAAPQKDIIPQLPRLHYFGNYELIEEIARGGMGVVYKARQLTLERPVALKMMRPGLLATDEEVRRFHAEATAAANLQHPSIVAIHEIGEFDGLHYFSMDLVEGYNLAELVLEGPLPPARAAQYLKNIAEAVQYAHSKGTLHSDLKPSNVLIDAADQPRITDFGLARPIQGKTGMTITSAVAGTPSYMPPEQAAGRNERLTPASDVYSLGAILYELLTGRPPFCEDTPVETLRAVLEVEPRSPRLLTPGLSRDLATICLKCLSKEPHKRYQSAQDLADDLGRFLRGEPILARPVRMPARVIRWCRRNPWPTTAVAALALLAAAGTISAAGFRERYWESLLQQARLQRLTGNRAEELRLLQQAAAMRSDAEVRQEAIRMATTPGMRLLMDIPFGSIQRLRFSQDSSLLAVDGHYIFPSDIQSPTRIVNLGSGRLLSANEAKAHPELSAPRNSQPASCPPDIAHLGVPLAFNASGRAVLRKGSNVFVWDRNATSELVRVPAPENAIARMSDDGRRLLIASPSDLSRVQVIRLTADGPHSVWLQVEQGGSVAVESYASPPVFSPNGRFLAAVIKEGASGSVAVWDTRTGRLVARLSDNHSPAWSPDSRLLATMTGGPLDNPAKGIRLATSTATIDRNLQMASTHIRVWKVIPPVPTYQVPESVATLAFRADGQQLVANGVLWNVDASTGALELAASPLPQRSMFSGFDVAGRLLGIETLPPGRLASPYGVRMWKQQGPERELLLKSAGYHGVQFYTAEPTSLAVRPTKAFLSPDGSHAALVMALSSYTGQENRGERILELWDLAARKRISILNQDKWFRPVEQTVFSPDGHYLAACGLGHRGWGVTVWNVADGRVLHEITQSFDCHALAFTTGNRLVTAGNDAIGHAWITLNDASTGNHLRSWNYRGAVVNAVAVSSDGQWLATAGADGVLHFWETSSARELASWPAHDSAITAMAFQPQSQMLITGASDGSLRLWNLSQLNQEISSLGVGW